MKRSTTVDTATRAACAQCGLPVSVPVAPAGSSASPCDSDALFCCHACRMVTMIVGRQERGDQSWNLLRLGLGALLAMNVMMLSLLLYAQSVPSHLIPTFRLVLLALSAPALAILLPPFLAGAAREFSARHAGLDFLIALGSLSAFSLSLLHVVRGAGEIYFDSATMLPVLVCAGRALEATAKRRAGDLLQALEGLLPATALLVTEKGTEEVAPESLRPGDQVLVRPGERVPVDGSILEGVSSLEEAPFSGEFAPRSCAPGDRVSAGTVNGTGPLLVRAERTGRQLLLHGIAEMVQQAWLSPAQSEQTARKMAALFLPLVLCICVGAVLGWTLAGDPGQGVLSGLSVLAVACPCTMGIATPLATSLAIARAARAGIVVRGGSAMEAMAKLDTVFFDKTGTVTCGAPKVERIELFDPTLAEEELLGRLAALESASEHALARAVVEKARERGVPQGRVARVAVHPGRGIAGKVEWGGVTREVQAGSSAFLGKAGVPEPDDATVIHVAWDGRVRGRLLLGDSLRPEARRCIEALRQQGMACVLLSGDRLSAAAAVASALGIPRVEAERTPSQKLARIEAAAAAGKRVAMVGDGINDAPALAAAPIGVALGSGMELAKLAGNVIILSGRLSQLPWLIGLSRRNTGIIRGNFAWSFAYNLVALAAAAAGLLHPLLAALAMAFSSLTVLGNSLSISAFPDDESAASHSAPPPPITSSSGTVTARSSSLQL